MTMTANEVAALGEGLVSRMSAEQLRAAAVLYSTISSATTKANVIPIEVLRQTFMNHLQRHIRMPAGGALAGGSQQTGFEMELVGASGVSQLLAGWPNHESTQLGRRQSWELRTMEELSEKLMLHESPAGWGAMLGKPIAIAPGRDTHIGVLMCGPPFTVTWVERPDRTTMLCVRFPLVMWMESDVAILPPDDADGTAFYVDPPGQPGYHRDLFLSWGRRVAGELLCRGFPMSAAARRHVGYLAPEYWSDAESTSSAGGASLSS